MTAPNACDCDVLLLCGTRTKRYPLPSNIDLQDAYLIKGEWWTVVAVFSRLADTLVTESSRSIEILRA